MTENIAPRTIDCVPAPDVYASRRESLEAFIRDHLREGIDYSYKQNDGNRFLYRAGAEKIALACGLSIRFQPLTIQTDRFPHFVQYKCSLCWEDYVASEGIGAASNGESVFVNKVLLLPEDNLCSIVRLAQDRALVTAVLLFMAGSDTYCMEEAVVPPDPPASRPAAAAQGKQAAPAAVAAGEDDPGGAPPGQVVFDDDKRESLKGKVIAALRASGVSGLSGIVSWLGKNYGVGSINKLSDEQLIDAARRLNIDVE